MTKTKTELKKIAQAALKAEYGFAPATLSEIILLEADMSGIYVAFEVRGNEYRFDSHLMSDLSVWVGKGTITKIEEDK